MTVTTTASAVKAGVVDRRHLHNYRVIQRNLVYVIGVPATLANEELLRKAEYFGQYGKIGKVVIHKNHTPSHASVSAYVTFVYKEDAKASIQSLDGFYLDGHVLRASFGTTKYCNNFIRGVPCNNPDCVYLHDLGDDDDRFTKEEIQVYKLSIHIQQHYIYLQAGHSKLNQVPGKDQSIVTGNGGPSGTGKRPVGETILPPPVFIQDNTPNNSSSISKPTVVKSSPSWPNNFSETSITATTSLAVTSQEIDLPAEASSFPPLPESTQSMSSSVQEKEKTSNNSSNNNQGAHSQESIEVKDNVSNRGEDTKNNSTNNKTGSSPNESSEQEITSEKESVSNNTTINSTTSNGSSNNTNAASPRPPSQIKNPFNGSFNGLSRSAVFPVPVSSLTISVWSAILQPPTNGSQGDLNINPFGQLFLPFSELLDLTLPPVDAVCLAPWPKPHSYYKQGMENDGVAHAPVARHVHRSGESQYVNPHSDVDPSRNTSSLQETQIYSRQTPNSSITSDSSTNNKPPINNISNISALRQIFPGVNIAPVTPSSNLQYSIDK